MSRAKRKITRFEKDGKNMIRWEFDGDVRCWDLATGELRETFKHNPARNVLAMRLSPDGSTFMTGEELPGEYEGRPPQAASLWDVKTRQCRPLPEKLSAYGTFSPDSKMIAISALDDDGYTTAVRLFDVATAQEKLSIPISENFTHASAIGFTPDGQILLGGSQTFPGRKNWETWDSALKFWDVVSGREVASFASEEKKAGFMGPPAFSPDGRTCAMVNWMGEQTKLYLFDMPSRKLLKTVILGEKAVVREPVFSPDGKWVAVATQEFPEELQRAGEPDAEDVPQPRIHLVTVAAGEVRETLVAPQGFTASVCFSPDGKTLATGGHGKVLLWDLSKPPGAIEP
ncbi:MAG: PD40 domain-containing protein [Planctomycetes bacterium]|nr:PD40 domain-containing protein [Planctomycetota bacterium]